VEINKAKTAAVATLFFICIPPCYRDRVVCLYY
jgi:hypothetical protein